MTAVKIVPDDDGYTATVNGTPIPIAAYTAEPGPSRTVMVALIVEADTLSIGIPPRTKPELEQTRTMNAPRGVWGDPGTPDPRQNMPGWVPPPATVDAGRERVGEHRHIGRLQTTIGNLTRGRRLA